MAETCGDERETTLKPFSLEGDRVRLQPANATMEPISTPAENVAIQGRLVGVVRSYARRGDHGVGHVGVAHPR